MGLEVQASPIGGMSVQVSQSTSTAPASLSILKTRFGNSFSPGQQNAVYSITVFNAACDSA
jgi:hypothetical protein